MNPIFRGYDIRGRYPEEINEDLAFKVGQVLRVATLSTSSLNAQSRPKFIVGHDARNGSSPMAQKLVEAITQSGCDVIFIRETTTPLFYFSVNTSGADGGVMVTASHNPKEYNGFKLVGPKGDPILNLGEIEGLMGQEFEPNSNPGTVQEKEFVDDYVNLILEETQAAFVDLGKLKIVVDTSNGMTGLVLKNVFKKININAFPIFFDIDGTFPNHSPDTSREESLKDLKEKVIEMGADLGVAFDGDGDRLAMVDDKGQVIWPDHILGLLYQAMGSPVTVYDMRVSRSIKHLIGERGVPSRVGYVNIKKTMQEQNADLGGELSGHFFFKEMHYAESAILAMLRILVSLSQIHKPISEVVKPFRTYAHSGEIRIEINNQQPTSENIFQKLKEKYRDGKIDETDGLMIEFSDWWFDIRPSNTEPILRLVIEAEDYEKMEEKKTELLSLIANS